MDVIDSDELSPSDAGTATCKILVLQAEWHRSFDTMHMVYLLLLSIQHIWFGLFLCVRLANALCTDFYQGQCSVLQTEVS